MKKQTDEFTKDQLDEACDMLDGSEFIYESIYMCFLTLILDYKHMHNKFDNGGLTFGLCNQSAPLN